MGWEQGRQDLFSDAWIHVVGSTQRCIFPHRAFVLCPGLVGYRHLHPSVWKPYTLDPQCPAVLKALPSPGSLHTATAAGMSCSPNFWDISGLIFPLRSPWVVPWDEGSSFPRAQSWGDLVVLLLASFLPGFLGRKFAGSFLQKTLPKEKRGSWLVPWHQGKRSTGAWENARA